MQGLALSLTALSPGRSAECGFSLDGDRPPVGGREFDDLNDKCED